MKCVTICASFARRFMRIWIKRWEFRETPLITRNKVMHSSGKGPCSCRGYARHHRGRSANALRNCGLAYSPTYRLRLRFKLLLRL